MVKQEGQENRFGETRLAQKLHEIYIYKKHFTFPFFLCMGGGLITTDILLLALSGAAMVVLLPETYVELSKNVSKVVYKELEQSDQHHQHD